MIVDNKDWECVIEKDVRSEVQKKLNQWKHEYDLYIESSHVIGTDPNLGIQVLVILWRKRRG